MTVTYFCSVKNKRQSNIHSWPTISLRLLQPTLCASKSLQTANKWTRNPSSYKTFHKTMLSSLQLSTWGSVGYHWFENIFAHENRRTSSSFKRMWALRSFFKWIDLIYRNSLKRLDWLQTLGVTLFYPL